MGRAQPHHGGPRLCRLSGLGDGPGGTSRPRLGGLPVWLREVTPCCPLQTVMSASEVTRRGAGTCSAHSGCNLSGLHGNGGHLTPGRLTLGRLLAGLRKTHLQVPGWHGLCPWHPLLCARPKLSLVIGLQDLEPSTQKLPVNVCIKQ